MHIHQRNVLKVEWNILCITEDWCGESMVVTTVVRQLHALPWHLLAKGQRSNNLYTWEENTDKHICCDVYALYSEFPSLLLLYFCIFVLFLSYLLQVTVRGVVWSLHLLGWRVTAVPVSPGVQSQPDQYLSLTLKTRIRWSKWQSTFLLGHVRPCVPTATWSSGKIQLLHHVFYKAFKNHFNHETWQTTL